MSYLVANVFGDTSGNYRRKIATDSNGNLYVTYAYGNQIYCVKSSDDGETWTDLGFPKVTGYYQYSPSIAIDNANNVHIVWDGLDVNNTGYSQIKYSKYDNSTWSNWVNIQTVSGYSQVNSSIAIDSNNNVHVIWQGRDASNAQSQIKYSKYDNSTWTSWVNIQTIAGYNQESPSIAIDTSNNLHVIWQGNDVNNASYYQIKYSKYDNVSWSAWINIQTVTGYSQYSPCIAIDSNNNVHIVWDGLDVNNTKSQIKYSKYDGSIWSNWINIQNITGYTQESSSIAIDDNDDLHVVWDGVDVNNTSYYQIKYSKFSNMSWSNWVNTQTSTNYNQRYPCIMAKESNKLIGFIWMDTGTFTVLFDKIEFPRGYQMMI